MSRKGGSGEVGGCQLKGDSTKAAVVLGCRKAFVGRCFLPKGAYKMFLSPCRGSIPATVQSRWAFAGQEP